MHALDFFFTALLIGVHPGGPYKVVTFLLTEVPKLRKPSICGRNKFSGGIPGISMGSIGPTKFIDEP